MTDTEMTSAEYEALGVTVQDLTAALCADISGDVQDMKYKVYRRIDTFEDALIDLNPGFRISDEFLITPTGNPAINIKIKYPTVEIVDDAG
jgi:hypothetical protein